MNLQPAHPVSMLRYVLGYFATKIAAAGALVLYSINIDDDPPISATIITFIAVSVSVSWFAKDMNRPMLGSERMWLAIGNTAAELILTIAVSLTMVGMARASFGWEGFSEVFGGDGDPQTAKIIFIFAMTFGLLPTPIFSVLFGWLLTKNLPTA